VRFFQLEIIENSSGGNVCFKYDQNYKTTQSISDFEPQMETVNEDEWRKMDADTAKEREIWKMSSKWKFVYYAIKTHPKVFTFKTTV
jgi:hypothetical protein